LPGAHPPRIHHRVPEERSSVLERADQVQHWNEPGPHRPVGARRPHGRGQGEVKAPCLPPTARASTNADPLLVDNPKLAHQFFLHEPSDQLRSHLQYVWLVLTLETQDHQSEVVIRR
jgi:hypothetical protein